MPVNNNLKELRKRAGLTQQQIAEELGLSVPQVSRWETGGNDIPSSRLAPLAAAYRASVAEIFADRAEPAALGPTLYVKGEVAAGIWTDAFEWIEPKWMAFTGRPDITAPLDQRFGLRVSGESMNLIYPHGSIVECLGLYGGGTIVSGRRVVVVREREDGDLEATVKEYVERDGEAWLWPRSSHPDFQQPWPLDGATPGIRRVSIIATVVASTRLEQIA